MNSFRVSFFFTIVLTISASLVLAETLKDGAELDASVTLVFQGISLDRALRLIAEKAGLEPELLGKFDQKVTRSFKEVPLKRVLSVLAKENNFLYSSKNGYLLAEEVEAGEAGSGGSLSGLRYRRIPLRYASAKDLLAFVSKGIGKNETVALDEQNNALIFYCSERTFQKMNELSSLYDKAPQQILIEAQIVETSSNFARDVGFSWGDLAAPDTSGAAPPKATGSITLPGPQSANVAGKFLLGSIDGRWLEAKITAAESEGKAKVISRPKVITVNNQSAVIRSGVTFSIKTVSSVQAPTTGGGGGSSTSESLTGGIEQVTAGISLDVLPTVMGSDRIRLTIRVTNSEADFGRAVDGIPGIVDNAAQTSIIVGNGMTATMAGLVKNVIGNSSAQVPLLSRLPLLGWLFSSHSDKKQNTELMIFITPHLVSDPGTDTKDAGVDPKNLKDLHSS